MGGTTDEGMDLFLEYYREAIVEIREIDAKKGHGYYNWWLKLFQAEAQAIGEPEAPKKRKAKAPKAVAAPKKRTRNFIRLD